jgi:phage shock protein A
MWDSFVQQITDQEAQVESLKAALKKLEIKLAEARAKVDLLIAQHRRSRTANRAAEAQLTPTGENRTFDRMKNKVAREQALGEAHAELLGDDVEGRFHALEREEKVEALLAELKQRKRLSA